MRPGEGMRVNAGVEPVERKVSRQLHTDDASEIVVAGPGSVAVTEVAKNERRHYRECTTL